MIRNEISTGGIVAIIFAGAYMAISTIWGSDLTSLGKMTYTNTVLIFLAVLVFGVVRGGNYVENYIVDRSSDDND